MPKSTIPKSTNYLTKRLAKKNNVKSLDELVEQARLAREAASDILHNKSISTSVIPCYFCKKIISKNKDNLFLDKKQNPPIEVMACTL